MNELGLTALIAITATASTVFGLVLGLWIHRSSGEIEARTRRDAMKYARDLVTGDFERRYRDARNRALNLGLSVGVDCETDCTQHAIHHPPAQEPRGMGRNH